MNLKLKLLLAAVVIATIDAGDTDYYDVGSGVGQSDFKFPANLSYVNFNNFCQNAIVREATLRGTFRDVKREDGNFYFSLRLQHNEKDAKKILWNAMTYALYVRSNTKKHDTDKSIRGYMYSLPVDNKKQQPTLRNLQPNGSGKFTSLKHLAGYKVGAHFELKMFFQPSHIVFVLSSDGIQSTWKHYYGYFYKESDQEKENHQGEFTDSIFDSIRIEGDVTIDLFKVRSGGPFTDQSEIPENVVFKPYKDRKTVALTNHGNNHFYLYEKTYASTSYLDNRAVYPGTEFELLVRGKMGQGDDFEFHVEDNNWTGYQATYLLTIKGSFAGTGKFKVVGYTFSNYYTKFQSEVDLVKYQATYQSYNDKYSANPFKKNTDFEMAVRALSYNQAKDKYYGYPRTTWQLTIRVECRIYTWYVFIHPKSQIDAIGVKGDVKIHQAVIIH